MIEFFFGRSVGQPRPPGVALVATELECRITPAAYTIDDLKAELNKHPDTKAILDAAIADGVTIKEDKTIAFGGGYEPSNKTLSINPDKLPDKSVEFGAGALLYELLRWKYAKEQLDLDKQAKEGKLTKEEYAKKCEELTYKYLQEHHKIMDKAVKDGKLSGKSDILKKQAEEDTTFEKHLERMKKIKHYDELLKRYDRLRAAPAPVEVADHGSSDGESAPGDGSSSEAPPPDQVSSDGDELAMNDWAIDESLLVLNSVDVRETMTC